MRIAVKRGKKAISTRTVKLTKTCAYGSRVSFANRRRLGPAKKLTFTARFLGYTRVLATTAHVRSARVRRSSPGRSAAVRRRPVPA